MKTLYFKNKKETVATLIAAAITVIYIATILWLMLSNKTMLSL